MLFSPFEIGMLACFGVSWPISIAKILKTQRTEGKSLVFAGVVLLGYVCGILHKLLYHYDAVVWLYAMNLVLVAIDMGLTIYFRKRAKC